LAVKANQSGARAWITGNCGLTVQAVEGTENIDATSACEVAIRRRPASGQHLVVGAGVIASSCIIAVPLEDDIVAGHIAALCHIVVRCHTRAECRVGRARMHEALREIKRRVLARAVDVVFQARARIACQSARWSGAFNQRVERVVVQIDEDDRTYRRCTSNKARQCEQRAIGRLDADESVDTRAHHVVQRTRGRWRRRWRRCLSHGRGRRGCENERDKHV